MSATRFRLSTTRFNRCTNLSRYVEKKRMEIIVGTITQSRRILRLKILRNFDQKRIPNQQYRICLRLGKQCVYIKTILKTIPCFHFSREEVPKLKILHLRHGSPSTQRSYKLLKSNRKRPKLYKPPYYKIILPCPSTSRGKPVLQMQNTVT